LFRIDACDFKVQQKIVEQLISTSKDTLCRACSQNAAFQLALCYSCGFGCRADSEKCRTWLEKSGRPDTDLESQLDMLREMKVSVATLRQLISLGLQSELTDEYVEQGILEEAIVEYQAMAVDRARAFGNTHFSTRTVRNILAFLLERSGRTEAAIELRDDDIMDAENEVGVNDQDILAFKCHQATLYEKVGRHDKARELAEAVLNSKFAKDGVCHLQALSLLSSISTEEGKFGEAIEKGTAAAEEGEKLFGLTHNRSLFARSILATAYSRSGNFAKAIEINEEVARIREKHLGPDNRDTIESFDRIGLQYNQIGDNEKASSVLKRVWESRARRLGKTAEATLRSGMNYAAVLPALGRQDEAASILETHLAEAENSTSPTTKDLAMYIKGNLAVAYQFQLNYVKADPLGRDVLALSREKYGSAHETTLAYMRSYSDTLFNQRKWSEAFDASLEEVEIRKTISSKPDPAKISAISGAALSAAKSNRWAVVASLLEQELDWRRDMMKLPEIEPDSRHEYMEALALAATAYMNLNKLQEAKCHVASFLEVAEEGGPNRSSIVDTVEDLAVQCDKKGAVEEAEQLSILEILIRNEGPSDKGIPSKELVKRILDLKERQGTVGSPIIFEPSGLIRRAKEARIV
jgi:tetratricopeptide (TPR) repeat protein